MNEPFKRRDSLGWLVNVLAHAMGHDLDRRLKDNGLSLYLWPTLMCLWEEQGVTQNEIAQKARVENSTTTRTLDRLGELGLAERRPDPKSRRAYRIYLTEKGKALEAEITDLARQVNEQYLAALKPREQTQLIELLKKIVQP